MDFYGRLAGIYFRCDLLVETAREEQRKHLTLARTQRSQAPLEFTHLTLAQTSNSVLLQSHMNGIHQVLVVKRFDQEVDGSSLHGFNAHRDVAMCGDEDNRNPDIRLTQLTLKVDAANSWQSYVQNQAARSLWAVTCEKFERRCEPLH